MIENETTSKTQETKMVVEFAQETKLKVSFGMKRKEQPKLVNAPTEVTAVEVDSDEEREDQERQIKKRKMTHFEDGDIGDDDTSKKSKVVIPMVVENDWRVAKLLELQKEGKLTETDQARLALLTEDQPFTASSSSTNENGAIIVDEEVEEKEIEDANYESVRIEDFGLAMLRGCGWKDGDGIGKNPQKVPLRLLPRRPNGLGLGATPAKPKDKSRKGNTKNEEELETEVKPGSFIKILSGRLANKYAKVESRDDDLNSVYARLALGNSSVKVLLSAVEIVSKKEYEREGKCINKTEYDKEKEKIEKRNENCRGEKIREGKDRPLKNDKYDDRQEVAKDLWARSGLIVRFVDDGYKNGRLYKCKLRVVDVASRKDISLEDPETGKIYYNLRQSDMETVIPRNEGDRVMIVRGNHSGSVAVMEDKDKNKYTIIARILHSNQVVKIQYDDVCQYLPRSDEDYDD